MTWGVAIAIALAAALPACSFRTFSSSGGPSDADPDAKTNPDGSVDAPVIGDASSDWWDPAWTRRRQITIKNTELTGRVQNFPLLVKLPVGVGPTDLRFIATDQRVVLWHELDTSDSNGVVVWVRIPDLLNTGDPPVLWVYYGNAGAPSTSNGAAVFGDLYVSVHHLGLNLDDSTGHNHTAILPGGSERPALVTGRVGDARDFDGNNDHLDLPVAGESAYDFTTSLSVSAWIKPQDLTTAQWMAIVTKGDSAWRLHRYDVSRLMGLGTDESLASVNLMGATTINDSTWYHVAAAVSGAKKRLYVNGQQDAMGDAAPIDTNDRAVAFGRNTESVDGGFRFWNGDLDEIRISAAARDAAWLFAEHHTVTDPDFVQVGAEQQYMP